MSSKCTFCLKELSSLEQITCAEHKKAVGLVLRGKVLYLRAEELTEKEKRMLTWETEPDRPLSSQYHTWFTCTFCGSVSQDIYMLTGARATRVTPLHKVECMEGKRAILLAKLGFGE